MKSTDKKTHIWCSREKIVIPKRTWYRSVLFVFYIRVVFGGSRKWAKMTQEVLMTPRKPAVRSRNSSPTRTTYHLMLLLFKEREREREWERLNVRERTKHRERKRSNPRNKRTHLARNMYSNDDHVPIIQNAVKTPIPPHCASFIADAVVGTISTFAEDQCARGMNVFNISLIFVVF